MVIRLNQEKKWLSFTPMSAWRKNPKEDYSFYTKKIDLFVIIISNWIGTFF